MMMGMLSITHVLLNNLVKDVLPVSRNLNKTNFF